MADEDGTKIDRKRIIRVAVLVAILLGAAVFGYAVFGATNEYTVTQGIHYNATDGPEVEVNQTINTTAQQPFPDENTVDLTPHGQFRSSGPTSVRATGLNSTWTNLSELDVSDNTLEADLSNKQTIEVTGDTDWIEYRDEMTVDDGETDFRYSGPDGGTTTVTIHSLPADSTIVAWDSSTGERLDFNTTTSNGVVTLSLPQSEHDVELRSPNEPIAVDGTASPTGGQSTSPDELAVDVDHDDFPDTEVSADFYLNGEHIGSDTVSDAGRANTSLETSVQGGTNNWTVVLEDDYGNQINSSYQFQVPDTLTIYNETAPTENVSDVDVELRFYFEGAEQQIVERTSTDGEIDMEGLPIEESFVVVADAEGYHPRRIYVDNLFESQQIYLLPTSEEYVDLTFELEDFTGSYPKENTVLKIERALNGEYRTVEGDFFGATGQFTSQLQHNTRHQLILVNVETGQERNVGTITPTTSGLQQIQVTGSDTLLLEDVGPSISIEPSVRSLSATSGSSVSAAVSADDEIVEWSMTVTLENNGTTQTLFDETMDGTNDSVSPTFNLTDFAGGSVVVEVQVTTEDGTTMTQTARYSIQEYYDHSYSLFATLARAIGLMPGDGEAATTFLSVLITLLVSVSAASLMQLSSEGVGAAAVVSLAAFAVLGWVSMSLVFACGVTGLTLFAVRRGI